VSLDARRAGRYERAMLRTTQDVVELRRWAELRGARPCRDASSGRLRLAFPGPMSGVVEVDVGWDEFEPAFVYARAVFVYDDAPGVNRCFIGEVAAARAFVCGEPLA
jgi:hypothetical protein